jgi:hypothetical protein
MSKQPLPAMDPPALFYPGCERDGCRVERVSALAAVWGMAPKIAVGQRLVLYSKIESVS